MDKLNEPRPGFLGLLVGALISGTFLIFLISLLLGYCPHLPIPIIESCSTKTQSEPVKLSPLFSSILFVLIWCVGIFFTSLVKSLTEKLKDYLSK